MATATLTSKGQITLPKEIRDRLRLEQGDELRFDLLPNGELRVSTPRPRPSAFGVLRALTASKRVDVAAMEKGIGEYLSTKHRRILRGA